MSGSLNLAVASSSLSLEYKPTVVIYVAGWSLSTFLTTSNKVNQVDFSNLSTNNDAITSLNNVLSKFSQVDVTSLDKTVSGVSSASSNLYNNFSNQTKGVDEYIKSIDSLTASLTKLEKQLNDMPKTSATIDAKTGANTRVIASSSPTSEMTSEDLQRQLNSKIDDLITHIVEMKQNTKDTADSINGRRSAV